MSGVQVTVLIQAVTVLVLPSLHTQARQHRRARRQRLRWHGRPPSARLPRDVSDGAAYGPPADWHPARQRDQFPVELGVLPWHAAELPLLGHATWARLLLGPRRLCASDLIPSPE